MRAGNIPLHLKAIEGGPLDEVHRPPSDFSTLSSSRYSASTYETSPGGRPKVLHSCPHRAGSPARCLRWKGGPRLGERGEAGRTAVPGSPADAGADLRPVVE